MHKTLHLFVRYLSAYLNTRTFLSQSNLSHSQSASSSPIPAELFSPLIATKIHDTTILLPNPLNKFPEFTDPTTGKWELVGVNCWTSGYLPLTLYELNTRKSLCSAQAVKDQKLDMADWLQLGRSTSTGLIQLQTMDTSKAIGHDVGFIGMPFAQELLIEPSNKTAQNAINAFANTLADRFNEKVGCTRSWDSSDPTELQVIIDNMMNLEVLWHAYDLTKNEKFKNIAISHADTTMKNHIRDDGSTWHVVVYNTTTGNVAAKKTAQGYSDSSTWSRGQAWGINAFSTMYKRTGKADYLTTARRIATWFLDHMPSDGIVPWDFDAPVENRPADSSAATAAATGFLLLSQVETNDSLKTKWNNAAIGLLQKMTALAWRPSWQSLLANGTVNKPQNNYLTGITYGDYYFIRAGNELVKMGLAHC